MEIRIHKRMNGYVNRAMNLWVDGMIKGWVDEKDGQMDGVFDDMPA